MRYILAFFISILAFGCTTAPPTPASVGSPEWRHVGRTDYESQSPGLGVSHKYVSSAGNIDVYVYDLQRGAWQPGVGDPAFASHFQSTIDEVKYVAERGDYRELQVGSVRDLWVAGQQFRSVSFRFVRGGRPMESLTFLAAVNGKLLKYRMSFFAPPQFDVSTFARRFIESTIRDIE